jgi:nucleoside-diphosphate-sugar epimerase
MRVLITGGAGFIGSHLADELLAGGDSVVVLDNLSTGSLQNIRHNLPNPQFEFVFGSVLDPAQVDEVVARCDVVFHLAAAVGVRVIVERTLESLLTNIKGSENVLEAALRHAKKVLITSTSEVYGKSNDIPLKEDGDRLLGSPLVGRWSYSTSKAVDEILAHAYWRTKGLPTVIVRLFNTVGPRQSAEYGMVLPRFIQAALSGKDLPVHGTGAQTRCFGYVGDIVPALIDLMRVPAAEGEAINLGSTEEVSILDLARLVVLMTGSSSQVRLVPYREAYDSGFEDMLRRVPDIGKAKQLVSFRPATSLRQTVQAMIDEIRASL